MRLFRSFATVSGFVVLSRILGFARDILIADVLGAKAIADAFFVAFRFPNMFRNLFAEGALNASFVPVFSAVLEERGKAQAQLFAEQVLAGLLGSLVLFLFAVEAGMPWFISVLAPGFIEDPEKFDLAVRLTRLTFPYLLFAALTAMLSGILNSLYRFAAAAAAPILLNVVLLAVLFQTWQTQEQAGLVLSLAIAVGGVAQFLVLVQACRSAGIELRLPRPRLSPDVRRMLRLMLPAAIGAGAAQINLLVGTMLASLLGTGAISHLYYAERITWLPIGIIGVAIATALLPRMSRLFGAGEDATAVYCQNRGIELVLLLGLPASVALIVMPLPIVRVLFVRGAYTITDAGASSAALVAFACGVPAYLLVRVLTTGFFARHDTVTPVKVAFVAVAVNIAASLSLMWTLGIVGIAMANVLAAWTSAVLQAVILFRRGHLAFDDRLRRRFPRIALASAAMAAVLFVAVPYAAPLLTGPLLVKVPTLAALVICGAAVYGAVVLAIKAATLDDVKSALRRGDG